jgi:hypothetical protein
MSVSGFGLVGGRTLAEHLVQALEDVLLGLLFLLVGVFGGGTCQVFPPVMPAGLAFTHRQSHPSRMSAAALPDLLI